MNVLALWIDDDLEYVDNQSVNIHNLDSIYYEKINKEINHISIIKCLDMDCAVGIINRKKIDVMIIDIGLLHGIDGHEKYSELFYEGKINHPAIVISGKLSNKINENIKNKGINHIIDKSEMNIPEILAEKIGEIIKNTSDRMYHLIQGVEQKHCGNNIINYFGKKRTTNQWIQWINANYVPDYELSKIMIEIHKEIVYKAGLRIESGYEFPSYR